MVYRRLLRRLLCYSIASTWSALMMMGCAAAADVPPTPGIVSDEPVAGPAFKVESDYMVPYTETIPGTDITFEMVPVPGGEFLLGSPEDEAERAEDEGPQVRITIEPFWIGKCEVTWAEYQSFMAMYEAFKKLQMVSMQREAGGDAVEEDWRLIRAHAGKTKLEEEWDVDAVTSPTPLYDATFTYAAGEQPNQPAVTMTQFAAKQYTKWLSGITGREYRLPSEAEWEYAARAGSTTAYSFGDNPEELGSYAWFEDNADYQTHPVGTNPPNPWGIHDMHGNVAEWTLDEYLPDAYAKLAPGPVSAAEALRWPTRLYPRVIRGGSWLDAAPALRSAARHKSEEQEWKLADPNIPLSPWWYTEEAATGVGMRIIRPLGPMTAEDKKRVWEADVDDLRQDVLDRLREGRGATGVVSEKLPDAIKAAEALGDN